MRGDSRAVNHPDHLPQTVRSAILETMTTPARCIPGFDVVDLPTIPARAIKPKPDDSTVVLRGVSVPLNSDVGSAFVADCARNRERIFSDDRIIEKYDISPNDWTTITQNKTLRLLVSAECERRMLNGIAAQESAAKIFNEAPEVLGSILRDNRASPKHRIDASRELRATARAGDEKSNAEIDRVHIVINLGADQKLEFNKQIAPIQPNEAWKNPDAETE